MPDVSINDLPSASSLQDSGLLVVYQNSQTQSVTGQKVKSYAAEAATEIAEPVAAAAVEDKFDDMSVAATTLTPGSQATATYNPDTNALTLGIPRGADGGGAGDMTKAAYDPTNSVYNAGGIANYVAGHSGIPNPTNKANGNVLEYNGSSWVAADPKSILNRSSAINGADTHYSTIMARGIYAGTSAMTPGTTDLTSGVIYLQYE